MSVSSRFRIMRTRRPRPASDPAIRALRLERRRRRLKVLPSLFTLGNACCGFAAIVQVASLQMDPGTRVIENPANLVHAAVLLFFAMLFDGLDGRIARMTQSTGDFGGELDSLCDAVSFGVAPAVMVAMANARAISDPLFAKLAWLFGLAFACGAILRLARFNVENSHDEDAHVYFKGLPSPAAAGTIASLVLLQGFLRDHGLAGAAASISLFLPFVALGAGYLMVSTVRYVHLPNRYLRGRKPARKIAQMVFLFLLFAIYPEIGLAVGFLGYAASGPAARGIEILRRKKGGALERDTASSPPTHGAAPRADETATQDAGTGREETSTTVAGPCGTTPTSGSART